MPRPATVDPTKLHTDSRKFLIHGHPGSGKSPLAYSYPAEKRIIIPCDRKELFLPGDQSHYIVTDYANAKDPYTHIKDTLEYDWHADLGTKSVVIIIDTGTTLAKDYLQAALNSYNAKTIQFGTHTIKMTDKPHFNVAHYLVDKTVGAIRACKTDVILVTWSDYVEPENGEGAFGGPLMVNQFRSKDIAGAFANVIYTRTATENGKTSYYAHTENCSIWHARLGGVMPNPVGVMKMDDKPESVWEKINEAQGVK